MNEQEFISLVKKHQQAFHSVVVFNPQKEKLISLNLTEENRELTQSLVEDTRQFSDYINNKLNAANAKFAIGGYAEHRTVYSRSKLFNTEANSSEGNNEPRRLHLGTDIWGRPHSAVMAPLNGIVHSFAFNNNFGDYGATIILSHHVEGQTFYTLYGHLSLNNLKNLQEGQNIHSGDVFAEFGLPFENGQWPPHLHFQLILNIGASKGDYPGVCKFSEKEKYLQNSPDPDLILQMNQYINSDEPA